MSEGEDHTAAPKPGRLGKADGPLAGRSVALRPRIPALLLGSLFALVLFGVDLGCVESRATLVPDRNLELWVHQWLGPPFYGFFEVMSVLGGTVDRIVELAIIVLLLAVWRKWALGLYAALSVAAAAGINTLVKDIVRRPRPHLFHHVVGASGYSFPSGHANDAVVFSAVLVFLLWRLFRHDAVTLAACAFAVLFAFLVGLSRIVLGVHYPSDVVGGYALGGAVALATTAALEWALAFRAAAGQRRPGL